MFDLPFAVNIFTVLFALIAIALAVWSWQAYREAETAGEAGQMIGGKAARTTGGIAGFVSALVVGLLAGLYDAGVELSQLGDAIADVVSASPELVSGIVTAIVGAVGISGAVDIGLNTYVGIAIILLGAGAVIKSQQEARG